MGGEGPRGTPTDQRSCTCLGRNDRDGAEGGRAGGAGPEEQRDSGGAVHGHQHGRGASFPRLPQAWHPIAHRACRAGRHTSGRSHRTAVPDRSWDATRRSPEAIGWQPVPNCARPVHVRGPPRRLWSSGDSALAQTRSGASDLSRSAPLLSRPTNAERQCGRRGIRSRAGRLRSPPPCGPPSPSRPRPQPVHASPIPQRLNLSVFADRGRVKHAPSRWGAADTELLAHLVVLVGCDPRLDEPCCRHTNLLARRLDITPVRRVKLAPLRRHSRTLASAGTHRLVAD